MATRAWTGLIVFACLFGASIAHAQQRTSPSYPAADIEAPSRNATEVELDSDMVPAKPRVDLLPANYQPEERGAGAADAGIDAQLAASGEGAFTRSCVGCHDAAKSMGKSKSVAQWRATVRRMAAKDGAEVDSSDVEPIAAYLAANAGGGVAAGKGGDGETTVTVFGTLSPTWRGGNDNLQNSGFFPDAWVGVSFQNSSAVSGRATACMSCHTEPGEGSRIEVVEAALRLDLFKAVGCDASRAKASVDFGRLVVPFGAFAQQSNPGVYRTVSKPLMYNMGFRILDEDLGDPVLPMPYSDEGAVLNLGAEIVEDVHVSWDAYVVNGLQGSAEGIDFDLSRDYVASNTHPAIGTRLTLGNQMLKLGSSLMSGQSSPTGGVGANGDNLYYRIYGFDATFRLEDVLRVQFEYARRDSDRIVENPDEVLTRDHVSGYYVEGEVLIVRWKDTGRRITFLARYDAQSRDSIAPPPESSLSTGVFTVNRFTYGFNFALTGGSVFMINHERWSLPDGLGHTDVLGVRWACSF